MPTATRSTSHLVSHLRGIGLLITSTVLACFLLGSCGLPDTVLGVTNDSDTGDAATQAATEAAASTSLLMQSQDPDTDIFHTQLGYDYLSTPGEVFPGAKYRTSHGSCSFGWLARHTPSTSSSTGSSAGDRPTLHTSAHTSAVSPGRVYMFTAGHCGDAGESVYVTDPRGARHFAGMFVHSTGVPDATRFSSTGGLDDGDGTDFALIDVTDAEVPVSASLPEPTDAAILDTSVVTAAPDTLVNGTWITEHRPRVCRIGFRSGLSCGPVTSTSDTVVLFRGWQNGGDSGGPVWVHDPVTGTLAIAAVASFSDKDDHTILGAALVDNYLNELELTVYH